MKADEKKLIFNLLKAASGNITGYVTDAFKNEPAFSDDEVAQNTIEPEKIIHETDVKQEETPVQEIQPASDSISSGKMTIDAVNEKISRCTRCQLARTRNNVVPGTGVLNPDVLVVGEGPGYEEDMQGLPFVGKAGLLLDKMLASIGLSRQTNCYIANIVKCRPPQNRNPEPDEQSACFSFLEAQIHILKPKMILCMGKISGQKLLDSTAPVTALRNQIHEYKGIPLVVTYHPSALLRNEELKRPAWEDLKLFKRKLDEILNTKQDK